MKGWRGWTIIGVDNLLLAHFYNLFVFQEFEVMEKESQSLSEQLTACEVVKSKAEKDGLQIQQLRQRVNVALLLVSWFFFVIRAKSIFKTRLHADVNEAEFYSKFDEM